jgi:hypothetical protein
LESVVVVDDVDMMLELFKDHGHGGISARRVVFGSGVTLAG